MLAVIADDLTGAAELAGICLRYGQRVELLTRITGRSDADIVIVCTDSRSMDKVNALATTRRVVGEVNALQPEWIYKKTDSVFRGYVVEELELQMQQTRMKKAILIGANPSLGRTIRDGLYYVDGQPVNETAFIADPEFAVTGSSVRYMLGDETVQVLKYTDKLPEKGIIAGEAQTEADLVGWAAKMDSYTVPAGAGDFFSALLARSFPVQPSAQPGLQLPHLYVCGTAFGQSSAYVHDVNVKSGCVAYLPASMMRTGEIAHEWISSVCEMLNVRNRCIVAIDPAEREGLDISALSLRTTMAKAVKAIRQTVSLNEIFIEGGSTASAVLAALDIHELMPVNELQRGVVRMKAKNNGIYVTLKPGSYRLPEEISALYS